MFRNLNILEEEIALFHIPLTCSKCGGIMIYEGVGEYHCEDCGEIERDDYGKVRNYIETHYNPNVTEIERGTGVTTKTILKLIKGSAFEVSDKRRGLIFCEMCQKAISSGRYCEDCEHKLHRDIESNTRQKKISVLSKAENAKSDKMHYIGKS